MDGIDQILAADVKMTPISGGLAPKTCRPHPVVMGALRTSSILLRGGFERPFPMDLGFGDELICQKVFCVFVFAWLVQKQVGKCCALHVSCLLNELCLWSCEAKVIY